MSYTTLLSAPPVGYVSYDDMLIDRAGKFAVIDTAVPLNSGFHYEVTIEQHSGDAPVVLTSDKCRYDSAATYPTDIPCVPVLLSDPLLPRVAMWLGLLRIDPLSYPARQDLKDVIGRNPPVQVSSARSTARTTFTFMTRTLEERQYLLNMFYPGRVLFYRNPDPRYPENNWYLAIGEVTEERIAPDHANPMRRWSVEVAVVDQPYGYVDITGSRTYDVLKTYEPDESTPITPPTYEGVKDDYNDYIDVLIGRRAVGGGRYLGAFTPKYIYARGKYPTESAAETSWSLVP